MKKVCSKQLQWSDLYAISSIDYEPIFQVVSMSLLQLYLFLFFQCAPIKFFLTLRYVIEKWLKR